MEPWSEPTNTVWPFPFTPQDWEQTPLAVQAYVRTLRDEAVQLHDRVETLEARLRQNSTTSSQPPSSDSPYKKPRRHTTSTTPRKAGGILRQRRRSVNETCVRARRGRACQEEDVSFSCAARSPDSGTRISLGRRRFRSSFFVVG